MFRGPGRELGRGVGDATEWASYVDPSDSFCFLRGLNRIELTFTMIDLGISKYVLIRTHKKKVIKEKNDKLGFIKIKIFCFLKDFFLLQ